MTKDKLEKLIVAHGGSKAQNPDPKSALTQYIIAADECK